jgi:hypothetical protein
MPRDRRPTGILTCSGGGRLFQAFAFTLTLKREMQREVLTLRREMQREMGAACGEHGGAGVGRFGR